MLSISYEQVWINNLQKVMEYDGYFIRSKGQFKVKVIFKAVGVSDNKTHYFYGNPNYVRDLDQDYKDVIYFPYLTYVLAMELGLRGDKEHKLPWILGLLELNPHLPSDQVMFRYLQRGSKPEPIPEETDPSMYFIKIEVDSITFDPADLDCTEIHNIHNVKDLAIDTNQDHEMNFID